jgi:DNA polymerase epsilon subunit 4
MEESHEPLDIIPPPPPPPSLSQADEGPTSVDADASAPPPVPVAKKAERKERRVREPGKSLLPLARVQRIIKADRVKRLA